MILRYMLSFVIIMNISFVLGYASGVANLVKFTQRNGTMTNINKGKVVSDQKAGYVTGGSIISRGPKPPILTPITVQPPSFAFDACSGSYDARFGGFSFITGKEFVNFLKAIPGATGAYALKMLIKEVCPQCEDITSYLETVARDINSLSLNQCSMAQSIAKGGLSMLNSSSKQHCIMQSNILSASADMFDANEKCTDNPDMFGSQGENDELKSLLGKNFNLVWKALNQGSGQVSTILKELMMSISGSVIGRSEDGTLTISSLPSLVEKEELVERYMGQPGSQSSEVTIYKCDELSRCLNPVEQNETLSQDETLYGSVTKLLNSVIEKVYSNDQELTDDEQALIEFSSIPLLSIIELELASKGKDQAAFLVGMSEFIEAVCYDLITNYMHKMVIYAKSSAESLKSAQLDNTVIDKFTNNVESVRWQLRDKRFEALKKLQIITQVKAKLVQQQEVFEMNFGRFMDMRGR